MSIVQNVGIVGSRHFTNYEFFKKHLDLKIEEIGMNDAKIKVVSGGARGVDTLAVRWAKNQGHELKIFRPNWKKYGRAAGPIRNKQIVQESHVVIAFWDGVSKGTLSSIQLAKKFRKRLYIIKI